MTTSIEWTELEINGASGPIRNAFLRQGGSCEAVALPGFRSGWRVPAVYYPVLCLVDRGADVLCLDSIYQTDPNPERLYQDSLAAIAAGTSAGNYREVVVIGKSLGTSAMAELSARGRLPVGGDHLRALQRAGRGSNSQRPRQRTGAASPGHSRRAVPTHRSATAFA
jgi:hypothetical protein